MNTKAKACPHGSWVRCERCMELRERRDRIAATLLSGFLANPQIKSTYLVVGAGRPNELKLSVELADDALGFADYLIARIDGKDPES